MILGLIPARGGSKSIPRKNIKLLAGKPLIAWTIEAALQSQMLSRVIVSTDDPEIAQVAREWGAETPFLRPPELARDDSSSMSVVLHMLQWLEEQEQFSPDNVLLLQPTSPFRSSQDICAAIALAETRQARAVVSVSEAEKHPYVCKRILSDGTLVDFVASDLAYQRRQDLPPAYALNGAIYLNQCESLVRDHAFLPEGTLAYIMPVQRSLDIDTSWDWRLAELILKDQHAHA
jgi:CMP-N,N'-diacetyllegionaminic acid synthase